MKNSVMAIAMLFAVACSNKITPSKTPYQNREFVNEKGTTMLIGHNAPYMMKQGTYKEWYDKNYNYVTDSATVQQLKGLLKGKKIEVFLGSWCGDSKREVPRMMKILEQSGYDTANLRLIFVDYTLKAYKQSPQQEERGKNIHHVPTFIVYNGKGEMGRIVESPVVSLEKDLLAIATGGGYTPNYKAILQWEVLNRKQRKVLTEEELKSIATAIKPACNFWGEFNAYGYMLLGAGKQYEAFNIFRLNALLFPDKPGPFSSLGEYYFLNGNMPQARKCYEKVLVLKPDDANAKKMLEQL